jgi:2-amino-4-hydroxy-6-hydroxymethyldihydropteridine diphosphokinase
VGAFQSPQAFPPLPKYAVLKTVYLSLGSNLGDRAAHLAAAIKALDSPDLKVVRASSIYETEPRDLPDQPWFLNQVIEAETDLFPRQLLARTQKVERDLGRKRGIAKGPRVIDVDILLFGEAVIRTPDLEIPHPRMAERRFVLEPLAELSPDLRHPAARRAIRELLKAVTTQIVRRV